MMLTLRDVFTALVAGFLAATIAFVAQNGLSPTPPPSKTGAVTADVKVADKDN